jgi:glycosyltransferase involved in cell wall biosynthesis
MRPLVSVIIPTCNRMQALPSAIESTLRQEGRGHSYDLEVVVIDDGSTDDTPAVVRQFEGVQFLRMARQSGATVARNAGMRVARGEYIAFLDDDDLWLPNRLRAHLDVMAGDPQLGATYGQNVVRFEGTEKDWPDPTRAPSGWVFRDFLLEDFVSIDTLLVRRRAFEVTGFFDEGLVTMGHYDMALRLSFHVPFRFVRGSIAVCRLSPSGSWHTGVKNAQYESSLRHIVENALSLLPPGGETEGVRRKARASVLARNLKIALWRGYDERIEDLMVRYLGEWPDIIMDADLRRVLVEGTRRLARTARAPLAAVSAVVDQVQAALLKAGCARLEIREFLARLWAEAALEAATGKERRLRDSCRALLQALTLDPRLARRAVGLLGARGLNLVSRIARARGDGAVG